ncbi:MAG: isopentenyl phosphate kinase [Chloroflexota bacterium]
MTRFSNLLFLKFGGSLITDKNTPRTARFDVIARLAEEVEKWRIANTCTCAALRCKCRCGEWRLVLGHGSGSFGHVTAKKYGTRQGVDSPEGWRGFAEVWQEAAALNRIVMVALHAAGIPAVAFPPSGAAISQDGQVSIWNLSPLRAALEAGLLPVVFGDVVFDTVRGGTILSTEDVFVHLARELHPARILLAGLEEGVWADYPQCEWLIPEITPGDWDTAAAGLGGSAATDVTGGMASKVRQMLDLTAVLPGLDVLIFSGNQPGNVAAALGGEIRGTRLIRTNRVAQMQKNDLHKPEYTKKQG